MKKLLIHFGTPKTGSSFVQKIFKQNYNKLKQNGILFPLAKIEEMKYVDADLDRFNSEINGQLLTRLLVQVLSGEKSRNDLDLLVSSIFSLGFEKVFLSDETLGVLHYSIWDILLESCERNNVELSVFCFYREPVNYYPSHWAQIVKKHFETRSLIKFCEDENLPIWRNVLAANDVVEDSYIFSYDECIKKDRAMLRACEKALSLPYDFFVEYDSNKVVNESLSLNILTSIRLINAEIDESNVKKIVEIIESSEKKVSAKPKLPVETSALICSRHENEIDQCEASKQTNF